MLALTPRQLAGDIVRFATQRTVTLGPIDLGTALELCLVENETECSDAIDYSHRKRLNFFLHWCDARGVENLNALAGRRLYGIRGLPHSHLL